MKIRKLNKPAAVAIALVAILVFAVGTFAYFADRVNNQIVFKTTTFSKDGYEISRQAPITPFIAGETVPVSLSETNLKTEGIKSEIHMSAIWNSPDSAHKIWGNPNSEDNLVIKCGSDTLTYDINSDGSISFILPENTMDASASDVTRYLSFVIPESLVTTGNIDVSFDEITIGQAPTGFHQTFTASDLNADEDLDFTIRIVWDMSKIIGSKIVVGYLDTEYTGGVGEYGIVVEGFGAMRDWEDASSSLHSAYKDETTSLTFKANTDRPGPTSIGNYAFAEFSSVTSVTIPESVTDIGICAFNNAGLSGELTIPKTVKTIESLAFGNLPNVKKITFEHELNDLTLPNNTSSANKQKGAFYVPSHVATEVNSTVAEIEYGYRWHDGFDNRRLVPMLEPGNYWQMETCDPENNIYNCIIDFDKLSSIKFVDYFVPADASYYTAWDVSHTGSATYPAVPGTVTAYLNPDSTELILAGNGYGSIFANPDSYGAFRSLPYVTSISGTDLLNMSRVVDAGSMFSDCYSLTSLNVSNWDMSNVTDISGMFYLCYDLNNLNVTNWDTGNVNNMASVFTDCISLVELTGIRNWDTQKVTNMARMFLGCNSIKALDLSTKNVTLANGRVYDSWDTGNVTNMSYMFGSSDSSSHKMETLNISTFDMRNVTNIQAMFQRCASLKSLDVSPIKVKLNNDTFHTWDVSKVEKMYLTFKDCQSLKELDLSGWDTSGIGTGANSSEDDFIEMFFGCTSLETLNVARKEMTDINNRDYNSWDTSKAMYMDSMFKACSSLKALDLKNWNNTSVTDMDGMFSGCSSLTNLELTNFTTAACKSMNTMFYNCGSLTTVDLSSFDTSKVEHMYNMFSYCSSLKKLDISNFDTASIKSGRINKFAQFCTSLTEIVLGTDFMQSGICPSSGSSAGLFYAGDPYSTADLLGTKITGANSCMKDYNWKSDFRGYKVNVKPTEGGSITANPTTSINGKDINLTVSVTKGYEYCGSTVKYIEDGVEKTMDLDNSSLLFTMPAADITITPSFRSIVPTLAPNSTWFDPATELTYEYNGNTYNYSRYNIDYITIVDKYAPTGLELASWDASANLNKSVMCYIVEDSEGYWELIMAGNGYGKLLANADSDYLFSDDSFDQGYLADYFANVKSITGMELLDGSNITQMKAMFAMLYEVTEINQVFLDSIDTSKVTDISHLFDHCIYLEKIDLSEFKTENVTDMSHMFDGCGSLTEIDVSSFITSKVINMSHMFNDCYGITELDLSNFVTDKVTDMSSMFSYITYVENLDLSNFNTANVTDMSGMFEGSGYVSHNGSAGLNISSFNTSKVTDMEDMFRGCDALTVLDLSNFNTSCVTNMAGMFRSCEGLTSLNLSSFDTSKVGTDAEGIGSIGWMFQDCTNLQVLDLSSFNTAKVKDMSQVFYGCEKLRTIYATPLFDTSKVTQSDNMFKKCTVLVGGAGTVWDSNIIDVTYARIDGGAENPGYFTAAFDV